MVMLVTGLSHFFSVGFLALVGKTTTGNMLTCILQICLNDQVCLNIYTDKLRQKWTGPHVELLCNADGAVQPCAAILIDIFLYWPSGPKYDNIYDNIFGPIEKKVFARLTTHNSNSSLCPNFTQAWSTIPSKPAKRHCSSVKKGSICGYYHVMGHCSALQIQKARACAACAKIKSLFCRI